MLKKLFNFFSHPGTLVSLLIVASVIGFFVFFDNDINLKMPVKESNRDVITFNTFPKELLVSKHTRFIDFKINGDTDKAIFSEQSLEVEEGILIIGIVSGALSINDPDPRPLSPHHILKVNFKNSYIEYGLRELTKFEVQEGKLLLSIDEGFRGKEVYTAMLEDATYVQGYVTLGIYNAPLTAKVHIAGYDPIILNTSEFDSNTSSKERGKIGNAISKSLDKTPATLKKVDNTISTVGAFMWNLYKETFKYALENPGIKRPFKVDEAEKAVEEVVETEKKVWNVVSDWAMRMKNQAFPEDSTPQKADLRDTTNEEETEGQSKP